MQSGKAARAPTMEILPPAVRSEQGQAGNGDLVARECPQCGTRIRQARSFGNRFICQGCKTAQPATGMATGKSKAAEPFSVIENGDTAPGDPLLVLRQGFVPRAEEAASTLPEPGLFSRIRPYLATVALAAICGWLASEIVLNQAPGIDRMMTGSISGLEITSLEARKLQRNGEFAVQVKGRITNRGSDRLPVETISVLLLDKAGNQASDWIFHPAIRYLDPGSSFSFSTAKGNAGSAHASGAMTSVAVTVGGVRRQTGF
ncbi:MAG: hypothetical protein KDJ48_08610 [Nitratireductor sp.]|nr:hypothetical protein [Nitratireductor sp.]